MKDKVISMKVPMIDLQKQYSMIKEEIDSSIQRVLDSGHFIMGEEVKKFEEEMDLYLKVRKGSSITCASGSDALLLALMAIDVREGDEIITTPFTFFATAGSIARLGAKPVFCDIDESFNLDYRLVESKITEKTKAILTVSLYGNPSYLKELREICKKHNLILIDDAAQSIGAKIDNIPICNYADFSTYSFFPTKNLGAYGDAGMLVVNNEELEKKVRMLRVHGAKKKYIHSVIGLNSRLDTLQAAILRAKLTYLDKWIERRRQIAEIYDKNLKGVKTPQVHKNNYHVYHQYTLMCDNRDELMTYLKEKGIETQVYYPLPLHLQDCFQYLGYKKGDFSNAELTAEKALSIPINEMMKDEQVEYVIQTINSFKI